MQAGSLAGRHTDGQANRQVSRQAGRQTRVPIKLGLVDGND